MKLKGRVERHFIWHSWHSMCGHGPRFACMPASRVVSLLWFFVGATSKATDTLSKVKELLVFVGNDALIFAISAVSWLELVDEDDEPVRPPQTWCCTEAGVISAQGRNKNSYLNLISNSFDAPRESYQPQYLPSVQVLIVRNWILLIGKGDPKFDSFLLRRRLPQSADGLCGCDCTSSAGAEANQDAERSAEMVTTTSPRGLDPNSGGVLGFRAVSPNLMQPVLISFCRDIVW